MKFAPGASAKLDPLDETSTDVIPQNSAGDLALRSQASIKSPISSPKSNEEAKPVALTS